MRNARVSVCLLVWVYARVCWAVECHLFGERGGGSAQSATQRYNILTRIRTFQWSEWKNEKEKKRKSLFTLTFISEKIQFKWPNYEKKKAHQLTLYNWIVSIHFIFASFFFSSFSASASAAGAVTSLPLLNVDDVDGVMQYSVGRTKTLSNPIYSWRRASWMCEQQIESQLNGLPSAFGRSSEWRSSRVCVCDANERRRNGQNKKRRRLLRMKNSRCRVGKRARGRGGNHSQHKTFQFRVSPAFALILISQAYRFTRARKTY